jgi:hypothetical protein
MSDEEDIAAGVKWLDSHLPGWRAHIASETLRLEGLLPEGWGFTSRYGSGWEALNRAWRNEIASKRQN